MNPGLAVVAALGSALCFATSSALQQHGAARAPRGSGLHLDLLLHLVRRPVWLAGMAAASGTLVLQAVALASGQLVVVQPLLVLGLLFALPLSVALERRRPSLSEWGWAAVLVVGLATFLLAAHPHATAALPDDGRLWQVGVAVLAVAAAVGLFASSVGRRHRAVLLGAAAGLTFGVTAALIKYCCALAGREGLGWLLTSWPPYALVLVGAAGIVLNQAAYQAGPLSGALPTLAIAEPLAAVLFGVVAFGERLGCGLPVLLLAVLGFLAMAVAIARLAGAADRAPAELRCLPTPALARDSQAEAQSEVEPQLAAA